jgi:hypothetical protein
MHEQAREEGAVNCYLFLVLTIVIVFIMKSKKWMIFMIILIFMILLSIDRYFGIVTIDM